MIWIRDRHPIDHQSGRKYRDFFKSWKAVKKVFKGIKEQFPILGLKNCFVLPA